MSRSERLLRYQDWFVALLATPVPILIWRTFGSDDRSWAGLPGAFLALAAVAAAFAVVHRRALRWTGAAGCGLVIAGAAVAAWAARQDGDLALDDTVWQAHFAIMLGSLLVATGATRSRALSPPAAAGAFLTSLVFLGAWGVGLAWIAWALAITRRHDTAVEATTPHEPLRS